jgi:hypothetical protein
MVLMKIIQKILSIIILLCSRVLSQTEKQHDENFMG